MNWAWATSLDQLWRSPTLPMWLSLVAAGFFAIIVLITLLRAEKSVANAALTVISLLAIGVAGAATVRGFSDGQGASSETRSLPAMTAALPALSCIDDLAGETVLTACEKTLFGSPESAAAALAYAASQISRLTAIGDVATAGKNLTPDLEWLRRSVERDRYGLMAYVLLVRDHCTPSDCAAFRSLTDRRQIVANMDERTYDGLIMRYSGLWGAPATAAAPAVAAAPPTTPTGRPTNADFPTAASTPPVNIMVPEPAAAAPASSRPPAATATAPLPSPRPTTTTTTAAAPTAAKKPAAKRAAAPVQLSPAPGAPAAAAPAADND
jgi:hypothetical protein